MSNQTKNKGKSPHVLQAQYLLGEMARKHFDKGECERTMANQKTANYSSFSECLFSNTSDREQERDEISRYYEHHQKLFES